MLTRFESLLDDYFSSDAPAEKGMPTVQYCADKLCLSANYFSDLCRKETGMSALKHIQQKVLDVAKEQVFNTSKSISEISYELGFPYPQHFSRLFKKSRMFAPPVSDATARSLIRSRYLRVCRTFRRFSLFDDCKRK